MDNPTQDNQSELREKLTCIMGGCIGSHENCFYETIEDAEIDSAEEMKQMVDMQISLIEAYVTTRVAEVTSKPLPRELKLAAKVANLEQKIVMLEADCATRVKEAERLARLQMSANVFTQFKQAIIAQDLSARPPKGARFRTPLEELSVILNHEAPLTTTTNGKEE